ncbi:TOBE domain-containing protein [Streptomyces sp. PT12]|uniref:TOBE domain-containing protein n=1 Tax=Streptomyces sp. PT12 TaxID=1510197 RepID=UPI0015EEAEDC|nr:TOBE domain-containing protein [Streptomyces sp. PT12]
MVYGVRPEYLAYAAAPAKGALSGDVTVVENLASAQLVTLEGESGTAQVVVAEDAEDAEDAPGTTAWAVPRPDRVLPYREGALVS